MPLNETFAGMTVGVRLGMGDGEGVSVINGSGVDVCAGANAVRAAFTITSTCSCRRNTTSSGGLK